MASTQIATLIAAVVIALVTGLLANQVFKALGVLWAKAGSFFLAVIVGGVALLAITALSAKCIEKCEIYETTVGPIFATPTPVPTQTPYVIYVYIVATPTSTALDRCTVVSGNGIGCASLP